MTATTAPALDAATFTIVSQGLHAVAQEMGEQLVRSAYSTIIREARDCSTSLLDREGRVVAQAQFCPIHMNSFTTVFEAFAKRYDLSRVKSTEALLTNDHTSSEDGVRIAAASVADRQAQPRWSAPPL